MLNLALASLLFIPVAGCKPDPKPATAPAEVAPAESAPAEGADAPAAAATPTATPRRAAPPEPTPPTEEPEAAPPEPAPPPPPNPNRLAFDLPLALELKPPPAPTDGTRFVALTDKLPLKPIAKAHRVRGGMHRTGATPRRMFHRPPPSEFDQKYRLNKPGWWFPDPDTPILVIPHARSSRGQMVEAVLLARPQGDGFVCALVGGTKTNSNADPASTIVLNEDQTELAWYREMSYVDEDVENLNFWACRVRGAEGGVESVCGKVDNPADR